jgi:tyrosyl-tRNA synthetase
MQIISNMSSSDIDALATETWSVFVDQQEFKVLDLFTQCGLTSSNGEAKKLMQQWSLYINEIKVEDPQIVLWDSDFLNWILLLRKGKKSFKVVKR